MVTLTQSAAKKVKEFISKEIESGKMDKSKEYGLRVGVMGGGCSGFQYLLDFDVAREGDHSFQIDGAKVIVDQKSLLYLSGSVVDYVDSVFQSGFVVKNPNVTGGCGCGKSVSF